jgi:hypothetical protein
MKARIDLHYRAKFKVISWNSWIRNCAGLWIQSRIRSMKSSIFTILIFADSMLLQIWKFSLHDNATKRKSRPADLQVQDYLCVLVISFKTIGSSTAFKKWTLALRADYTFFLFIFVVRLKSTIPCIHIAVCLAREHETINGMITYKCRIMIYAALWFIKWWAAFFRVKYFF